MECGKKVKTGGVGPGLRFEEQRCRSNGEGSDDRRGRNHGWNTVARSS